MYSYEPGSEHRVALKRAVAMINTAVEIPVVINGLNHFTANTQRQVMPSQHSHVLAHVSQADELLLEEGINVAVKARHDWAHASFADRAAVLLKAADLMATKHRYELLAATMLGQGKSVWQAEIDIVEAIDFLRFNVKAMDDLLTHQPELHSNGTWNRLVYRALEGFVAAVSPFNFTAIAANLATAPLIMGNSVLWKPSHTATLSNYLIFQTLREAGLPPGVLNFVPADGPTFGNTITASPSLAAINFTGSTKTFNHLWTQVGQNIASYRSYPRLIGECGGKNFHVVHNSADTGAVVQETVRSAFEYSGQKCSACSRLYVPKSLWPSIQEGLWTELAGLKLGQSDDFSVFTSAVIDQPAYNRITRAITAAKASPENTLIYGGTFDSSLGYFVNPTVIQCSNPQDPLLTSEIFGPVLAVYVYPDEEWLKTLSLVNATSPYALTGAVFARDRQAISQATSKLQDAAGNFYVNCKSTGAIVGQQPFGGSRSSGTNDKAGFSSYLLRFVSMQSVKESSLPLSSYKYPHMQSE